MARNTFVSFAEDLAKKLESHEISYAQACGLLQDSGYTIWDSGCYYSTYRKTRSLSKNYIHIWGTLVSEEPWEIRCDGMAWGNKDKELGRVGVIMVPIRGGHVLEVR